MRPVLQVPLSQDLSEFTRFLWANEVPHRVTEDETDQTLWVSPRVSGERVVELYAYWEQGGDLNRIQVNSAARRQAVSVGDLKRLPVTLALIALSILATLAINFGANADWLGRLSFSPFDIRGNEIYYSDFATLLGSGEYWRLITPIFLHFSMLHILFNLLWIWVIGRRIEQLQGAMALIGLALFSGVTSNFAQFVDSGPLFGGMSGVVFAVLGYSWVWDRLHQPIFYTPPAVMGFMLFWLALGYSGALEFMGLGAIANTAHLIGLVAGLIWAALMVLILRR